MKDQSRRRFIKSTGAVALGSTVALNLGLSGSSFAVNSDTLKIGLIGCGGRGTGAANQALNADPNVVLTQMADIFEDRMSLSVNSLKKRAWRKGQSEEVKTNT